MAAAAAGRGLRGRGRGFGRRRRGARPQQRAAPHGPGSAGPGSSRGRPGAAGSRAQRRGEGAAGAGVRRPPGVPRGRNVSVTLGAASRRALGAAQPGGRSGSGPKERRSAVAVRGRGETLCRGPAGRQRGRAEFGCLLSCAMDGCASGTLPSAPQTAVSDGPVTRKGLAKPDVCKLSLLLSGQMLLQPCPDKRRG